MKLYIPTIREPPLEEILRVYKREFGYLNPEVDKEYIEVIGLGSNSLGVYVADDEAAFQALAHLHLYEGLNRGSLHRGLYPSQVHKFLDYLLANGLINEKQINNITIIKPDSTDNRIADIVYLTLKARGYGRKTRVVESELPEINMIFDREGGMYLVDPISIRSEEINDVEMNLYPIIKFGEEIKCKNTGRFVSHDAITPGLLRTFHHIPKEFGSYILRIPVKKVFDEEILNALRGEGEKLGINIFFKEYENVKYVEFVSHGYRLEDENERVLKIYELAARFVDSLYPLH